MNRSSNPVLSLSIPGDKSISHRALIISALSEGSSEIEGLLLAEDPKSTLTCLQQLGCQVEMKKVSLQVQGTGLRGFFQPAVTLDAGNSGTTLRLLSGLLVGQNFPTVITGDESLRRRPMMRIIRPLTQMGGLITGTPEGTAPIRIEASSQLQPITYESPSPSAQVKSAILLAGLYADGTTRVIEEVTTRDHTERMLGLKREVRDGKHVTSIVGGTVIYGRRFVIPGDISSAAFLIGAAIITPGCEVIIENVGINPSRTKVLEILKNAGATIDVHPSGEFAGEPVGTITAKYSCLEGRISLGRLDVIEMVDEIPIAAVLAANSGIPFEVRGARELRVKESDRIGTVVSNLRAMGVEIEEYEDGFAFESGGELRPAKIATKSDHRIAMAFGVLGLSISGLRIDDPDCVHISFLKFWEHLEKFRNVKR